MTVKRSEFYTLTSTSSTDLQSIDLQGSKQVVLKYFTVMAGQTGILQNTQNPAELEYMIFEKGDSPITCFSNDGYLYFRSLGAYITQLHVWVIR